MSESLLIEAYVFVLAVFIGFEVVSKVPSVLHTPLMSATNAIHGIVLIAAMLVAGVADNTVAAIVGFFAVVLGALNVFGGFVVTDRMLQMFRPRTESGA